MLRFPPRMKGATYPPLDPPLGQLQLDGTEKMAPI